MAHKIAVIGSTGLVGSRVTEILRKNYEVEEYNSSQGFDIKVPSSVSQLEKSDSEIVVHMAAKAHVDGCEEDKSLGKEGDAWKINVDGTKNVAETCQKAEKKLIYISTDFVFDGNKPVDEKYTEEDTPGPLNWYGQTKYEGESFVKALSTPWTIVRIAYPYRQNFETKTDFVRAIKSLLEEGKNISAVTDHLFSPTYIDDIAHALHQLIEEKAQGVFHVTGSQTLSPFDATQKIAEMFNLDKNLISETTREEYFKGKAPRPYNLSMDNGKITDLGVQMKTFEEGLNELKIQQH